tara:strand:- start:930 stop:1091 length:162 start_codon:yes stop_codon:yes gene_type:complete
MPYWLEVILILSGCAFAIYFLIGMFLHSFGSYKNIFIGIGAVILIGFLLTYFP